MPLTSKGQEILGNMEKEYGPKKGESVFYASRNAGRISGVDSMANGRKAFEYGQKSTRGVLHENPHFSVFGDCSKG